MRYLSILCACIACLFLSGCIQSDTVIRVNPDGSGVIEETVLLSNALLETLQNFSKGMSEGMAADTGAKDGDQVKDKPQAKPEDPIKGMIKDARSREKQYGPDVKFVSAVPIKDKTMSGYKAVYAFKDINTLRINQNPEGKTMQPQAHNAKAVKKEEIIRFNLVKGPVSTLTVMMPEPKPQKKPEVGTKPAEKQNQPPADPNAAAMMKEMFKDMRISVSVEVAGRIVKTNAAYHDKTRVTLLDMSFGKIFENEKLFERLNSVQPKTVEEMKAFVKDIKGLKVEMNNPVIIYFR